MGVENKEPTICTYLRTTDNQLSVWRWVLGFPKLRPWLCLLIRTVRCFQAFRGHGLKELSDGFRQIGDRRRHSSRRRLRRQLAGLLWRDWCGGDLRGWKFSYSSSCLTGTTSRTCWAFEEGISSRNFCWPPHAFFVIDLELEEFGRYRNCAQLRTAKESQPARIWSELMLVTIRASVCSLVTVLSMCDSEAR